MSLMLGLLAAIFFGLVIGFALKDIHIHFD